MIYPASGCASPPDGKLAVSPADGVVRDARTGDMLHAFGVVRDTIDRAAFSARTGAGWSPSRASPPCSKAAPSASPPRRANMPVRDAATGKEAAYLPGVSEVVWSRDGSRFAYFEGRT